MPGERRSGDVAPLGAARLAGALLAGTALAALWVALTALDGRTYHLAPALIAVAPAALVHISGELAVNRSTIVLLAAGGGLLAAGGWIVIVSLGLEPTATVLPAQPGGVEGEVLAGGLVGAIGGALLLRR